MNEEIQQEIKSKKKFKKEDVIGSFFGISLAQAIGLSGVIPYLLGIVFGIWIANKMLNGEKSNKKILFWLLFVLVFIGAVLNLGMRSESGYSVAPKTEDVSALETDKTPKTSEVSENMYRNTKYNFRIKFPEGWKIEVGDGIHIVQKASFENSTISVLVKQFDLEGNEGFTSIKDAGSSEEFINSIMEGTKSKFSDVRLIGQGETRIDNELAYWVEYSASSQVLDQKLEMTNLTYFIAKGDTLYSISAGTDSDEYEKIKPKFSQSVSTFVLE